MSENNPTDRTNSDYKPFIFGPPISELYRDPSRYDPGDDLEAAVRVALLLGMPLLLTGEPGCGKTTVSYWLAWKLGFGGPPLVHNVKSTTTGRELLYDFDEIGRFRDSQAGEKIDVTNYIWFNALGLAILFSSSADTLVDEGSLTYGQLMGRKTTSLSDPRFGRRYVVLIDELDKAPRDTPNDLLLELEQMRFRIGELKVWIEGSREHRPVVIITSNSEKSLPEPFLRRCVFHHIKSPDDARRRQIIARRGHPFGGRAPLFDQAMRLFDRLQNSLGRPPGTAELLAWLTILEGEVIRTEAVEPTRKPLKSLKGLLRPSLGMIAKTREDMDRAEGVIMSEGLD